MSLYACPACTSVRNQCLTVYSQLHQTCTPCELLSWKLHKKCGMLGKWWILCMNRFRMSMRTKCYVASKLVSYAQEICLNDVQQRLRCSTCCMENSYYTNKDSVSPR